jgi:hypothetical protein
MWEPNDAKNFQYHSQLNVGQVDPNNTLGTFLTSVAEDTRFKTFLEIGTWNGQGSTRCFYTRVL